MASQYKDLLLEREAIIPTVNLYSDEGKVNKTIQPDKYCTKIEYQIPGQLPALLNVYHTNDGRVTLFPSVGKNQALSDKLAKFIVENCTIEKNFNDRPLRVNISEADLGTVVDFLIEGGAILAEKRDIANGKQIKVKGKYGDSLAIMRYNTGTTVISGRAFQLKIEVVEILTKVLSLEDVVQTQLTSMDSQMKTQEVFDTLKSRLSNSYDYLGDTVIAILSPCVALDKVEIEVQDYTFFVFPALRGLEGYIKRIFAQHGVVADANSFGTYFEKTDDSYKLVSKYQANFTKTVKQ